VQTFSIMITDDLLSIRNGRRDGFGVLKYPSGESYIGEFRNDQKHGKGTSFLEYGVHEGLYLNDLAHDKGVVKVCLFELKPCQCCGTSFI